jgi:hypothetical protein
LNDNNHLLKILFGRALNFKNNFVAQNFPNNFLELGERGRGGGCGESVDGPLTFEMRRT